MQHVLEEQKCIQGMVLLGHSERQESTLNTSIWGRIILKWALKRYNKKLWIRQFWLTVWKSGRSYGHDDKPSDSIKCREFLE